MEFIYSMYNLRSLVGSGVYDQPWQCRLCLHAAASKRGNLLWWPSACEMCSLTIGAHRQPKCCICRTIPALMRISSKLTQLRPNCSLLEHRCVFLSLFRFTAWSCYVFLSHLQHVCVVLSQFQTRGMLSQWAVSGRYRKPRRGALATFQISEAQAILLNR